MIGSRLWLTNGAKASLDTQQLAESASAEGLDHFRALSGLNVGVKARYASREMLALVCVVAKTQITLNRVLS